VTALEIPRELAEGARRENREAWLDLLPDIVGELAQRWSLDVGDPYQPGGSTAWVAPARTTDGEMRVLKVVWPHVEAAHEADGLRVWAGAGAVRLYDAVANQHANALLVERCEPGTTLRDCTETVQDTVVAGLLRRLWVDPPGNHPFDQLSTMCDQWAEQFDRHEPPADLDPALARDGIALFRSLPRAVSGEVLLCTDLHAGNVLRARREPWLAIDPKPYVGDPTYDALQHMLNCPGRLRADPQAFVRRIAALLDLDTERLSLWLFARCVQESPHWPGLAEVARALAP
jgi:streptomycin 6-kinase